MQGVRDGQLGQILDNEYQKPQYALRPRLMDDVREYIQRLLNSKEIRRKKKELVKSSNAAMEPAATKEFVNTTVNNEWRPSSATGQRSVPVCWNCNKTGHISYYCPLSTTDKTGTPAKPDSTVTANPNAASTTTAQATSTPLNTNPNYQRLEAARKGFGDLR